MTGRSVTDRANPQLNQEGELHHLLAIEGLPREVVERILNTADSFINIAEREVKNVPLLRGKSVFNLFFENSTRTRTTFEIAARRLSADVFNLDIVRSSAAKGESLLDTIDNLTAMQADMFVVRHATSGAPYLIARHTSTHAPHIHVINAGDGRHAHPTQGLLDAYTIRHYKKDFSNLIVAVVGDILHSRVARSDIHVLETLGVPEVRAVGPLTLLPAGLEQMGVRVCTKFDDGIRDADVIIMLRLQASGCGERTAFGGRILCQLWTDAGQARARETRCDRDASGTDEPRRRDRLARRRWCNQRDSAAGDLRHRDTHGGAVDRFVVGEHPMKIAIVNGRSIRQLASTRLQASTSPTGESPRSGAPEGFKADRTLDAKNLIVIPGLVDLCHGSVNLGTKER